MFITLRSAAVIGLDCKPVDIEVDVSKSWPGFVLVGLGDTAVKEAKERIRTAWKNTGLLYPHGRGIVVNLAPADTKKEGTSFDLPIALGLYITNENMDVRLDDALFVGELALNGTVRHVNGVLPLALYAKAQGFKRLFVPQVNAEEAAIVTGIQIYPVRSFGQLLNHIHGKQQIKPLIPVDPKQYFSKQKHHLDMAHVKGQAFCKRAMEIAASGGHNILLSGPPGSGKTLLSRTLPSILPPLTTNEAIEVTKIYSVAGMLPKNVPLITTRPFRSPHHSASHVALVGGGRFPRPGEISLAHHGILFLDEFPEFPRQVLENLRGPLEDGLVTISRAQGTLTFPASFTLVASQNPCPCGYASDPEKNCDCTPVQVSRYKKKISGPLIDRIDLHVEVPRVEFEKLADRQLGETSSEIQKRVCKARNIQTRRFTGQEIHTNSEMKNTHLREYCEIDSETETLLKQAMHLYHLSARSFHRILKVARTIADLTGEQSIRAPHVAEALQYRPKME